MAPPKIPRRYWDSFCFIALMDENDRFRKVCELIINEASDGNLEIVVSPLTLAEVVRPKGSPHPIPKDHEKLVRDFFENDYIVMRNLDRELGEQARQLCWDHALHPRDAIHVATAIDTQCECFETGDPGILRLDGKIGSPALVIRHPTWTGQLPLPESETPTDESNTHAGNPPA